MQRINLYGCPVPRLWADSVELHREQVRALVYAAIEELVATRGLLAINMSRLAEATGIGRATLYKYFGDIEEVLAAWHHHHVAGHLAELQDLANRPGEPSARLRAVLGGYGRICQHGRQHGADALVAALHHGDRMASHQRRLQELFATLLSEAAAAGAVRRDVPPDELANYCLHALSAAADAGSNAATSRLISVVLAGLTASAGDQVTGEVR
jgi:AcrR family transcriptional regulator